MRSEPTPNAGSARSRRGRAIVDRVLVVLEEQVRPPAWCSVTEWASPSASASYLVRRIRAGSVGSEMSRTTTPRSVGTKAFVPSALARTLCANDEPKLPRPSKGPSVRPSIRAPPLPDERGGGRIGHVEDHEIASPRPVPLPVRRCEQGVDVRSALEEVQLVDAAEPSPHIEDGQLLSRCGVRDVPEPDAEALAVEGRRRSAPLDADRQQVSRERGGGHTPHDDVSALVPRLAPRCGSTTGFARSRRRRPSLPVRCTGCATSRRRPCPRGTRRRRSSRPSRSFGAITVKSFRTSGNGLARRRDLRLAPGGAPKAPSGWAAALLGGRASSAATARISHPSTRVIRAPPSRAIQGAGKECRSRELGLALGRSLDQGCSITALLRRPSPSSRTDREERHARAHPHPDEAGGDPLAPATRRPRATGWLVTVRVETGSS